MYAVTGAAGNTGQAAVRALVARGERVRAIVRSPERGRSLAGPQVAVVAADIQKPDELLSALSGAEGAYLVRPPATRAGGAATAASFADVVSRTDVERLVVLSSIGAQHATGTGVVGGLHDLEEALSATGRMMTFVRAASFLENWLRMLVPVRASGVLPSLVPADCAFAQVSAADVGEAVAALLVDGSAGRRIVGVDGPEQLSPADIARAFGARLGKPVSVFHIPLDAQQSQLEAAGVPGPYAAEVIALYAGIFNGTVSRPSGESVITGPTTLDAWVAAHV